MEGEEIKKKGVIGSIGKLKNLGAEIKSINEDLKSKDISEAEKKDLRQKKKDILKREGIIAKSIDFANMKDGDNTDFGMLSVKAGIDKNPKPTQADRIAGATKGDKKVAKGGVRTAINKIKRAKDGARTGVRGTGAATKGFRKARLS